MLYYLVPTYLFLIYTLQVIFKDRNKFLILVIPAVVLLLFIGMFRHISVGTDTYMYFSLFKYPEKIEVGYIALVNILKRLGSNFTVFLSVVFFTALCCKLIYFKKLAHSFVLAILIYSGFWFLVYDLNAIRQGLALGFVGLSLVNLNEKKYRGYYLMMVLAIINHYSAIVFLPLVWFVRSFKCTAKIFLMVLGVAVLLTISKMAEPIITYISNVIGAGSHLASKASAYQNDDEYNRDVFYSISTVIRILVAIISLFTLTRVKINHQLRNMLLWCALLNIVVYIVFSQFEIIATRLSLYYRFAECIIFSLLPQLSSSKFIKFLVGLLVFVYVALQIYQTLSIKNNNLIPYRSVIDI